MSHAYVTNSVCLLLCSLLRPSPFALHSFTHHQPQKKRPAPTQTQTLSLLCFANQNPDLAAQLPKTSTRAFHSRKLGSTTNWSPRHSNLTKVTKDLPSFSSLVRVTNPDKKLLADPKNPGMAHPIAIPPTTSTASHALPSSSPLRQKIYDFDNLDENTPEGHIYKNSSLSTTLSVMDGGELKQLTSMKQFKVTVLTPEMSQYAHIMPHTGGRLLGKGGVQFLAEGQKNPKKSFFTFKFDNDLTSDEQEIEQMEQVEMVKDVVMTHGQKTFRGSVVVNLDLTMLGALEQRLNIDFSKMEKKERSAFFTQNRISIVKLLGDGGGSKIFDKTSGPDSGPRTDTETLSQLLEELSQRSPDANLSSLIDGEEDDDDDLSKISELTGPGKDKLLSDFNTSLQKKPKDEEVSITEESASEIGKVAADADDAGAKESTAPRDEDEHVLAEPVASLEEIDYYSQFANAFPPAPIEDLKVHPFYEGVLLTWEPPADNNGAPIIEYKVRYTAVEHKKKKKKNVVSGTSENDDDENSLTSDPAANHGAIIQPQEIRVTGTSGPKVEDNEDSTNASGAGDDKDGPSTRTPPPRKSGLRTSREDSITYFKFLQGTSRDAVTPSQASRCHQALL